MLILIIALIICAKLLFAFSMPIAILTVMFGNAPNLTFFLARLWSKFLCWGYRARPVTMYGQENISHRSPQIFISNHQCWMDGIIIWAWLPVKFRWLLGRDWVGNPFFDFILKAANSFTFPPDDQTSLVKIAARIKSGRNAVYFAEKNLNHKLGNFQAAGFEVARMADVPIIPVSISGAQEKFPNASYMPVESDVLIHFGTPINPRDYEKDQMEELMNDVKEAIKEKLPEDYHQEKGAKQ